MDPKIPDELLTRTAAHKTVLFVGAGLSRPQLPGWADLLHQMLAWTLAQGISLDSVKGATGPGVGCPTVY